MNQQDTFTQRVAAVGLVVALLAIIGGIIYLAAQDKRIEAALTGALGLIIGALLPSPISKNTTAQLDPRQLAAAMPTVIHLHPEDIAKIRNVPVPRARGQKGEVGCATLVIGALALIGLVALLVWAFS